MDNAKIIKLAKIYFETWNMHNIKKLRTLLSNKVCLQDWEIKKVDIEHVLEANKKIFKKCPDIYAEVLNLGTGKENQVVAQLKIHVDEEVILDVIDVLTFDNDSKIKEIKAYKC